MTTVNHYHFDNSNSNGIECKQTIHKLPLYTHHKFQFNNGCSTEIKKVRFFNKQIVLSKYIISMQQNQKPLVRRFCRLIDAEQ